MAKNKPAEKASKPKQHAKFLAAVHGLVDAFNAVGDKVDRAFSQAVDAVKETLPKTDMGQEGMRLHIATMAFLVEAEKYDNRMDLDAAASPEDQPHDEFWSSLVVVEKLYKEYGKPPKSFRAPETVEYLVDSVKNHAQIAAMLGLFMEDGRPDLARLQQEIAKPGSVIDDDFVHPDDAKRDAKLEVEHVLYVNLLEEMAVESESHDVCPETPEELYRQDVKVDQAINMLKAKPHEMTPEEVTEKWVKFKEAGIEQRGVPTTGRTGQPLGEYVPSSAPLAGFAPPHEPALRQEETTVETIPDSVYAQASDEELQQLCEVAEIPSENMSRDMMVAALDEADKQQAGV